MHGGASTAVLQGYAGRLSAAQRAPAFLVGRPHGGFAGREFRFLQQADSTGKLNAICVMPSVRMATSRIVATAFWNYYTDDVTWPAALAFHL